MILILADSLRRDFAEKYLKGIFEEETWSHFRAIETFTAPVLASVVTGKSPEQLDLPRTPDAFLAEINPNKLQGTLFDEFDSHVTISRLIGNGPKLLPPSRRDSFKFMPPINWNAITNNDDDVLEYVGRKWSHITNDWWDFIFYHCWLTHGPWGVDCYGPKEIPPMVNCDRWMRRHSVEDNHKWYKLGIEDFAARLRGLQNISNNKETIIVFADHGEALGEDNKFGHYSGERELEFLLDVPIWINRKVDIPQNISHLSIKDFAIEMYNKFEKNDKEIQGYRNAKRK